MKIFTTIIKAILNPFSSLLTLEGDNKPIKHNYLWLIGIIAILIVIGLIVIHYFFMI
jgi:hypothetical protein